MGGGLEQAPGVAAKDALAHAIAALTDGKHDPRIADGAQANALESIAWSLIGILRSQVESPSKSPDLRSLSDELQSAGFLKIGMK
jgi:hypothetical protein